MLPSTSWRGLFVTLALIGVVSMVGGLIAGPFLHLRLSRHANRRSIVGSGFFVVIDAGTPFCLFGSPGLPAFAFALFPASLMGSTGRLAGAFLLGVDGDREAGAGEVLGRPSYDGRI